MIITESGMNSNSVYIAQRDSTVPSALFTPKVWTQTGPHCQALTSAQMMTYLYRIINRDSTLRLSPNPLLFHNAKNMNTTKEILQDRNRGLEAMDDDQPLTWDVSSFAYSSNTRYTLDNLVNHVDNESIIQLLKHNFGPGGNAFPILAVCKPLGILKNSNVARWTRKDLPFRMSDYDTPVTEETHAVVITGFYTMKDHPRPLDHSIEIKCNWGPTWGTNGFAWVTAEAFTMVAEPIIITE
ncbi:hypothetical protein L1987_85659 [Smallanthus sonchifolius]|uniref:Uncharacterized protein n=1 Tax=Smallanthus sonchifolius TaxID=185202 RepID=A0ACB8XX52_9ASTR|nr:hypothetical protein L1987_85659 [Smallanthus sonchifolius]